MYRLEKTRMSEQYGNTPKPSPTLGNKQFRLGNVSKNFNYRENLRNRLAVKHVKRSKARLHNSRLTDFERNPPQNFSGFRFGKGVYSQTWYRSYAAL